MPITIDNAHGFNPLNPFEPRVKSKIELIKSDPLHDSIQQAILKSEKEETSVSIPIKSHEIDDALLAELNDLLLSQESIINEGLENLENNQVGQLANRAITDIYDWASTNADIGREGVEKGVEFLESVLPPDIVDNKILKINFKVFGSAATIVGIFLQALDLETKGLAVICKARILNHSRELLNGLKKEWEEKSKENDPELREELATLQQRLQEWEIILNLQDKSIVIEKVEIGLVTPATVFGISGIILEHLPTGTTGLIGKIGTLLTWIAAVFAVVLYGIQFAESLENFTTMAKWADSYRKWQIAHHHIPNATEEQFRAFRAIIDQSDTIDEIRTKLAVFTIELDPKIPSKEELIERLETDPNYQQELFATFMQAQRTFAVVDTAIQKSEDLLEKRKNVAQQKFDRLAPNFDTLEPQIKQLKREQFDVFINNMKQEMSNPDRSPQFLQAQLEKWGFTSYPSTQAALPFMTVLTGEERQEILIHFENWEKDTAAVDKHFQTWYATQTQESLLKSHVDHQETLELTTKNALREIVTKKHIVELRFFDFAMSSAAANFTVAFILLVISGALAIAGLITTPIAGLGLVLIGASAATTIISLGLAVEGIRRSYLAKPATFKANLPFEGLYTKILWARVQTTIRSYFSHAKEKKLVEIAKILYALRVAKTDETSPDYSKALKAYKEAKADFLESQEKIAEWNLHLQKLQERYAQNQWQDLALHANLQVNEDPTAFDSLRSLNEALKQCDLTLLSDETKSLLAVQLGFNLKTLNDQFEKDPDAAKKILQHFASLEESWLISYLKIQKGRMEAGIIPKLSQRL